MRGKLPTVVAAIVVLLLAVDGALFGLKIPGAVGVAAGAALVALSGVVAAFVPPIRDRAEQRRAELERAGAERVAAEAALKAASEPEVEAPESGPSLLLRPELAVVEFAGRRAELAELRAWCELDTPRSVRVIAGSGGVGKTRLALQVKAGWEASNRTAVIVAAGQESEALGKARAVTASPVLLVVDYAETRPGLGELLRAVLDDSGPVRVLLLARSLGEWWERLGEESSQAAAQLLSRSEPIRLETPVEDIPDRDLAASAVPYFAARLAVAVPVDVVFELPERRVPVLVLHTAALVAVLRSMTSPPGSLQVAVTERVLGELLEHEARYWRRTAKSSGLIADGSILKAVIAAAILLGAEDLTEAADLAGRIPDLAGTSRGDLRRWGHWLFALYPGESAGRLGSVQPDLLAEHHVITQLAADTALAEAILTDLSVGQAGQALTVLARAWTLHDRAKAVIETALRADLAGLAIPAASVAIQTSLGVADLLTEALASAPVALEDLIEIGEVLPYPSTATARAALAVALRVRGELPPETGKETVARWADMCGLLLSQVGRPAEALPPTEEAVATYRELTAAVPDLYRQHLAQSLNNLGILYSKLGRHAEALPLIEEAIAIRRKQAADVPDPYRHHLAQSLNNLGIFFLKLGRPADALRPGQEAVAIYGELAATIPDQYSPDLAQALINLGAFLSELGHFDEALPPTAEAIATLRHLTTVMPDRYSPDLAQALSNVGILFWAMGSFDLALRAGQEAVATYRDLAIFMPDRYCADLANSLTSLGAFFSELGQFSDSLRSTEEAVAIYRQLAAEMPDQYRLDLAQTLTNLSAVLSDLGRNDEAEAAKEEADRLNASH